MDDVLMKATRSVACLILCARFAGAQTFSSHGGWSFSDTMGTTTDVLVGDIVAGSRVVNGNQIEAKATVRVVRVLQSGLQPGTDVAVFWHSPLNPVDMRDAGSSFPAVRGMWFLRRTPGGAEALQASIAPTAMGGRVLELPQGPLPGSMFYTPDLPLQAKIGRELAWGIVDLVNQHEADPTVMNQLNSEREATSKSTLENLHIQLSSSGWKVLEEYLKSMAIGGVRITVPK